MEKKVINAEREIAKLKIKGRCRNKKSQMMQLPFGMIFSIILIVFFLAVAFFAIKYFLGIKNCSQIGLFMSDFQEEIDDVYRKQSADFVFERQLPSGIQYVCFANLSLAASTNIGTEISIFDELKNYADYEVNFFFYPRNKACDMPVKMINHLNMSNMRNPYCIENKGGKGKISIKISKGFDDALVKVS